jgi:hypothetical protein
MPLGCKVGNERLDFGLAHLAWLAFVMKEIVAADPIHVGLFCVGGVMSYAQCIYDLIE